MKVITLYAPYGTLIAAGVKVHETRSWKTKYRGPIAIHQGLRFSAGCPAGLANALERRMIADGPGSTLARLFAVQVRDRAGLGCVVALADVVDCLPTEVVETTELDRLAGDFAPGRFAWRLANVRPLETPAPARGKQGLWEISSEIFEASKLAPALAG